MRVEADASGRMRLHLSPLDALETPASLVELRATVTGMLPEVVNGRGA